MSFVNAENKKKINNIVSNLQDFAVLVDEPQNSVSVEGLDCQAGLGMHTEAESFRALSHDIEEGVFKTLVMGKFKNGKSTFINALVGRLMMAAKATATTAVIATVSYGEDNNQVYVYYKDSEQPKVMSLERFTREFQLSEEDQKIIEDGQKFDKFANVSHAEMHSNEELFEDGVRLIDSPGLEEDNARTTTTAEFVPKANAIIFTLNATSLFSAQEREYIAENFAGKGMRNVFFVINRINQLSDASQLDSTVKPSVKYHLQEVFKDKNGKFDEELYNKRVFYVDAYGALCAATNTPYKVLVGRKEIETEISKEETGMPEFEAALKEFLNSNDRLHATFSSTLTGMANTYQSAVAKAETDKVARGQSKAQRVENAKKAEKDFKKAQDTVDEIRNTVKSSGTMISQKLYNDIVGYVQNDLPREFAAHIKDKNNREKFGVGSLLKLAGASLGSHIPFLRDKSEREQKAVLEPLVNSVNKYIKEHLETWSKRVPTLISQEVKDLQNSLNEQSEQFDISLENAVNTFAYGNARGFENKGGGFKSGLQTVIALSNWDISLAAEGAAKGGMGWGDFAKRAGLQIGLDLLVQSVFGATLLIPALVIEAVSMAYRSNQTAEQLLTTIGNNAFKALADKIRDNEGEFKMGIIKQFTDKGEETAKTALSKLNDAKTNMDKLLREDDRDSATAETENARVDSNLQAMHNRIDSVYAELYGCKPTEAEFANLGKNQKEHK